MSREIIAKVVNDNITTEIKESSTNITAITLLCKLANETQFLEIGKKTLVKFITKGSIGTGKENVFFDIKPNDIFELTTQKWEAKARTVGGIPWKLYTYITAKKSGDAKIHIKIDGIETNIINLTTNVNSEKDVFSKLEVDSFINENKVSLYYRISCIVAADKQLGKLLNNSIFFITESSNNNANVDTAYIRANQLKKTGFIKSEKILDQFVIKGGGNFQPEKYTEGKENIISDYIKNEIKNKHGYHVFYFTILDGYHVLTLIVNSLDPCNKTFTVYDQLKERNEESFENLDSFFLDLTVNNWIYGLMSNNDQPISTKMGIWKIQKK